MAECFAENDALRREIARLQEDNEDLRASARWWIFLYDAALARANRLESQTPSVDQAFLRRPSSTVPGLRRN